MRKPLFTLTLLLMLAVPIAAQVGNALKNNMSKQVSADAVAAPSIGNDSVFRKAVIVKINPLEMAASVLMGEIGGAIQYNINSNIAVFGGGGYNMVALAYSPADSPASDSLKPDHGYTIRAGVYYFFKAHHFISFQGFYRKWNTVTNFDGNTGNSLDFLLNPMDALASGGHLYERGFRVDRTWATVTCFDFLFGKQVLGKKNSHVFFDWYVGSGLRFKTFHTEELGAYDKELNQYTPAKSPNFVATSETDFDIKLGLQVGVRF